MAKTSELERAVERALRHHGELYGVPLRQHVSSYLDRDVAVGAIYAACDRLEASGLVVSREGESTAKRGWLEKRYWKLADHIDPREDAVEE